MKCPDCHSEIPTETLFCPRCDMQLSTADDSSECKYAAFISYRHIPRDMQVARRVQEAIETYRLPKSLQQGGDAQSKALGKCFRDEDELAASHSLPDSIRDALAQSRVLIVICSPETKDSPWVQREIETFASLHGRKNIICVLAGGESSESIPEILRTRFVPDAQGIMREMPAEPLAADLRAGDRKKQKAEMLRIIAAVANCDLDTLRQRHRARRNKRIAIGAVAAILLVVLIGFLVFYAAQNSEEALIAQSKSLAAQSQEQLARGERIQAVETALSALPTSAENPNRPIVPEAQAALEDALGLSNRDTKFWKPNFAFDADSDIVSFASSTHNDWVALLEADGSIEVLDVYTGKVLSRAGLQEHGASTDSLNIDEWMIASAGKDRFMIANRYGDGNIACINAFDGSTIWEESEVAACAIAFSEDEEACIIFTIMEDFSVLAGLVDTGTGEALAYIQTPPNLSFDMQVFSPCYFDSENLSAYVSFGKYIDAFYFNEGEQQTIEFSGVRVTSLYEENNILLGASAADKSEGDPTWSRKYFFDAKDVSGDLPLELWNKAGIYQVTVAGDAYQSVAFESQPSVRCTTQEGERMVACTAGSELALYSVKDGHEVCKKDFGQSIVSLEPTINIDGSEFLAIVLSDGSLEMFSPLLPIQAQGTSLRASIPYQLGMASSSGLKENGLVVTLMCPAKQHARLLSYTFDVVNADDTTSYSLDELLERAHQLID